MRSLRVFCRSRSPPWRLHLGGPAGGSDDDNGGEGRGVIVAATRRRAEEQGLAVAGGGHNVTERFTFGPLGPRQYAYTGTWGRIPARRAIREMRSRSGGSTGGRADLGRLADPAWVAR